MDIKDIKFKAKRLDTGEWVKGDLVHSTSYIGICIYHPNNIAFNPRTHMRMPLITGINDYAWELHVVGNKFDKKK